MQFELFVSPFSIEAYFSNCFGVVWMALYWIHYWSALNDSILDDRARLKFSLYIYYIMISCSRWARFTRSENTAGSIRTQPYFLCPKLNLFFAWQMRKSWCLASCCRCWSSTTRWIYMNEWMKERSDQRQALLNLLCTHSVDSHVSWTLEVNKNRHTQRHSHTCNI